MKNLLAGRGDFLPAFIGAVILFYSVPSSVMILLAPDRNSSVLGIPLLIIFGIGIVIGCVFILLGVQLCSTPGSRVYRISHGRFFGH